MKLLIELNVPDDADADEVRDNVAALLEQACDGSFDLLEDGEVKMVSVTIMEG